MNKSKMQEEQPNVENVLQYLSDSELASLAETIQKLAQKKSAAES